MALELLLLLGAAPLVHAGESPPADAELDALIAEANAQISSLNFARAASLLEQATRDPHLKTASSRGQAKLWAQLGRARAELDNPSGMEEAFRRALRLDHRVRLPKETSPKIREALERLRGAPLPNSAAEKPKEPPIAAPPSAKASPSEGGPNSKRPPAAKAKVTSSSPAKPRPRAPALIPAILGPTHTWARVRLSVGLESIPDGAEISAHLRKDGRGAYVPMRLVRTGTLAVAELQLEGPRVDLYFEARGRGGLYARAGSREEPITIIPTPLPKLAEAWAQPPPAATSTVTSTATSAVALATPLAAPAIELEETNLSPEVAWLLAGGTLLVALVISGAIIIGTSQPKACGAQEGFGCVEVQVLPLRRWSLP